MRAFGATPPELTHTCVSPMSLRAAVDPVAAGDPRPKGDRLRNGLAHRARHEKRERHAPVPVSAPAVRPPVRYGRLEGVQEIAVRHVQLDDLEAEAHGTAGGVDEGAPHALDAGLIEFCRRMPALVERNR